MAKKKSPKDLDFDKFREDMNRCLTTAGLPPAMDSCSCVTPGILIPSVAFQRLVGTNVIPLSRIIQLVGKEGSFKTTLSQEIIRWVLENGGVSSYIHTESKNTDLCNALLRWKYELMKRLQLFSATSYEDWLLYLRKLLSYYSSVMEESGSVFPFAICIDSVTAVATDKELTEAEAQGFCKAAFPELAKRLNIDLKGLPSQLGNVPGLVMFVNHAKPGVNSDPKIKDNIPGGRAIQFYSALTLEMTRVGDITSTKQKGSRVRIQTRKAVTAKTGLTMLVDVLYWSEDDPIDNKKSLQMCAFDWDKADIDFLTEYGNDRGVGAEAKKRMEAITGLHVCKKGVSAAVWSDVLGIPEDNPLPYHEAGIVFHNNNEVVSEVQKELGIQIQPIYTGGVDYVTLCKDEQKKKGEHIKSISEKLNREPISLDYNLGEAVGLDSITVDNGEEQ